MRSENLSAFVACCGLWGAFFPAGVVVNHQLYHQTPSTLLIPFTNNFKEIAIGGIPFSFLRGIIRWFLKMFFFFVYLPYLEMMKIRFNLGS